MADNEKSQQDFCKNALDSVQHLIGRMDLKAGIVITIVGLLSAAIYVLFSALINCMPQENIFKIIIIVSFVCYFGLVISVLMELKRVFLSRPPSLGNYSQAPLMLFPLLILSTFKSDKDYAERALKLTHKDIVADYSNQIMECANIYKLKHDHVNKAIRLLGFLIIIWFLCATLATFQILSNSKHSKSCAQHKT
jgi:hypothetical protein